MPCYDGRDREPIIRTDRTAVAILCGVLRRAEADGKLDAVLDTLDYRQIGLTQDQVRAWWESHKDDDKG